MADIARAEALVQAMDRDTAFQAEVQGAHTVAAKRGVLDAHGFSDVSVEDMRAYVESHGGTFVAPPAEGELSEAELSAVAGGLTNEEAGAIAAGTFIVVGAAAVAA